MWLPLGLQYWIAGCNEHEDHCLNDRHHSRAIPFPLCSLGREFWTQEPEQVTLKTAGSDFCPATHLRDAALSGGPVPVTADRKCNHVSEVSITQSFLNTLLKHLFLVKIQRQDLSLWELTIHKNVALTGLGPHLAGSQYIIPSKWNGTINTEECVSQHRVVGQDQLWQGAEYGIKTV